MPPSRPSSSKSKPWSRSELGGRPVLQPSSHYHRGLPVRIWEVRGSGSGGLSALSHSLEF